MPQKVSAKNKNKPALILLGGVGLLLISLIGVVCVQWYQINFIDRKLAITQLSTMIEAAVMGLQTSAPVDPKTGDIYFPQAKLYLPAPANGTDLTYHYDADGEGLSISDRKVLSMESAKLRNVQRLDDLGPEVPGLQACSRGVRVTYSSLETGDQLKLYASVPTSNGHINIYKEEACAALNSTAEMLKNIRPY
jgi:hypothetical protein